MSKLMDDIAYLSQEIGPRPAGTEEEQQAALYIADQIQKRTGFAATIEDFAALVQPGIVEAICFGVPALVSLLAIILNVLTIPAFLITLACAILYVFELMDRPVLSRLFERGVSQNVVARYTPGTNAAARNRKIVLVANYDSGKVQSELSGGLFNVYPTLVKASAVALIALPVLFLLRMLLPGGAAGFFNILTAIALILVLVPVAVFLMHKTATYNEAANNNAAGVATLMRVAQYISDGSYSEEELAAREDVTVHGEEEARAAGVVPEGAQLEYAVEPNMTDEERLASAKAAVAALTGEPIRERHIEQIEFTRMADRDDIELYNEDMDYGEYGYQETEEEAALREAEEAFRAAPTEMMEPVVVDGDAVAAAASAPAPEPEPVPVIPVNPNEPSWYTTGRAKAVKPAGADDVMPRRSRYADALDAALAASKKHMDEAARKLDETTLERISQMKQQIGTKMSAADVAETASLQDMLSEEPVVEVVEEEAVETVGAEDVVEAAVAEDAAVEETVVEETAVEEEVVPLEVEAAEEESFDVEEDEDVEEDAEDEEVEGYADEADEDEEAEEEDEADDETEEEPEGLVFEEAVDELEDEEEEIEEEDEEEEIVEAEPELVQETIDFGAVEAAPEEDDEDEEEYEDEEDLEDDDEYEEYEEDESDEDEYEEYEEEDDEEEDEDDDEYEEEDEPQPADEARARVASIPPIDARASYEQRQAARPAPTPRRPLVSAWAIAPDPLEGEEVAAPAEEEVAQEEALAAGHTTAMAPVDVSDLRGEPAPAAPAPAAEAPVEQASHDFTAIPVPASRRYRDVLLPHFERVSPEAEMGPAPARYAEKATEVNAPVVEAAPAPAPAPEAPATPAPAPVVEALSEEEAPVASTAFTREVEPLSNETFSPAATPAPVQEAPVVERIVDDRRASLRQAIPSLSGEFSPVVPVAEAPEGTSEVSKTGSFAAVGSETAFEPVGDELVADLAPEDRYVEDADDSSFEESTTASGAYAGPGYVDMPESRIARFFNRFRRKEPEEETSASEWLNVDENFNPTEVGAARGSWESFRTDVEEEAAEAVEDAEEYVEEYDEYSEIGEEEIEDENNRPWHGGAFSQLRAKFDDLKGEIANRVGGEAEAEAAEEDPYDALDVTEEGDEVAYEDEEAVAEEDAYAEAEDEGEADAAPVAKKSKRARKDAADEEAVDDERIAEEAKMIYSFRNPDVNTEVWFVALGSEYAGNGGMKAFLAEHADEMRGAIVINLEAMGAGDLTFIEEEGLLLASKPSSRLKRFLRRATEVTGIGTTTEKINWRESAASLAMKRGIQAMTIAGMEGGKPALLGQGDDVLENIDEAMVEANAEFVYEVIKSI